MTAEPTDNRSVDASASQLGRLADEFLEAIDQGNRPDIEELASRHPELADVIRQVLPAMVAFRTASDGTLTESQFPGSKDLGDFRLVRELGRGGMGLVYEAIQHSLGRRVAIKVLPLAAILDERHLRRFQNEAHAAAVLQHPHIVSVYGVGCERGVHYYAMQLIEGLNLAEILRGLTHAQEAYLHVDTQASTAANALLSTENTRANHHYRAIATLAIQAADALAYAHREGVIHRDIKPSNLLLDRHGKLWITDFGLARVRSGAELTVTGDVLGTLRYMSPEQLTDNKVVDQRTDVYSLGMTLYEMLARKPAFDNLSREQLAQKILVEDPTPLRKLDASIPADLETIILRATAKDRDARYQTADDLADDLRRFVEHKPIIARRLTLWQRLKYWTRRNPALATTAAALLLATLALAIGGPFMAWRQRQLANSAVRNLYISDMNLAYDAWYRGHVDRVEDLLQKQTSQDRYGDSRDFAYRYLQRLCRAANETVVLKRNERFEDVAVAPDGGMVACGGAFPGVMLVDLTAGIRTRILETDQVRRASVAFSPDGTLLVASAKTNFATIWDTSTWTPRPVSHTGRAYSIRFAPDSQMFAAGTADGELTVWDRNGQERWSKTAHAHLVYPPAFSPDSQTLATASEDHRIRLWDAATGHLIRDLARLDGPAFDIAWAQNGKLLIVAGAEGIFYLDPESGNKLRGLNYDLKPVASIAVHGDLLATGGHDHVLQFWDIASGVRLGITIADRAQITGLAFMPDGQRLVAVGGDGTLRIFSVQDVLVYQEHLKRVDWEWPAAVAVTGDGTTCVSVAASLAADQPIDDRRGELVVWNVATGRRRNSEPVAARFGADVAVSFDGRVCASAGFGGVEVWELATTKPSKVLLYDEHEHFWSVAVSPDGRWVVAGGKHRHDEVSKRPRLFVWDLTSDVLSPQVLEMANADGDVLSLAFSADGQRLAVAHGDWVRGAVDIWTLREDAWRETYPLIGAHGEVCTDVAFVPGTDLLASSGYDGVIGVRHPTNRTESREFRSHIQAVFSLAVSPDGKLIASGADREIRLWDRLAGDQLATLQVSAWVSSIAFTPDGRTLIWGGGDGSVHFERTD